MTAATAPELSPQRVSDTLAERPGMPRPRSSVAPSTGAVATRHTLTATSVFRRVSEAAAARAPAEAERAARARGRLVVRMRVTVTAGERAFAPPSEGPPRTGWTPEGGL